MPAAIDRAYRLFYRAAFRAARLGWRLRRPAHRGALVGIHVGPDLLLVRQSYRLEFSLPGGGVERGEQPLDAVRRELREELGLERPAGEFRAVLTETGLWDHRRDTVSFFTLRLPARPALRIDNREIVAAFFVTPDEAARLTLTGPARRYLQLAADAPVSPPPPPGPPP